MASETSQTIRVTRTPDILGQSTAPNDLHDSFYRSTTHLDGHRYSPQSLDVSTVTPCCPGHDTLTLDPFYHDQPTSTTTHGPLGSLDSVDLASQSTFSPGRSVHSVASSVTESHKTTASLAKSNTSVVEAVVSGKPPSYEQQNQESEPVGGIETQQSDSTITSLTTQVQDVGSASSHRIIPSKGRFLLVPSSVGFSSSLPTLSIALQEAETPPNLHPSQKTPINSTHSPSVTSPHPPKHGTAGTPPITVSQSPPIKSCQQQPSTSSWQLNAHAKSETSFSLPLLILDSTPINQYDTSVPYRSVPSPVISRLPTSYIDASRLATSPVVSTNISSTVSFPFDSSVFDGKSQSSSLSPHASSVSHHHSGLITIQPTSLSDGDKQSTELPFPVQPTPVFVASVHDSNVMNSFQSSEKSPSLHSSSTTTPELKSVEPSETFEISATTNSISLNHLSSMSNMASFVTNTSSTSPYNSEPLSSTTANTSGSKIESFTPNETSIGKTVKSSMPQHTDSVSHIMPSVSSKHELNPSQTLLSYPTSTVPPNQAVASPQPLPLPKASQKHPGAMSSSKQEAVSSKVPGFDSQTQPAPQSSTAPLKASALVSQPGQQPLQAHDPPHGQPSSSPSQGPPPIPSAGANTLQPSSTSSVSISKTLSTPTLPPVTKTTTKSTATTTNVTTQPSTPSTSPVLFSDTTTATSFPNGTASVFPEVSTSTRGNGTGNGTTPINYGNSDPFTGSSLIIIGAACGAVFLLVLLLIVVCCLHRHNVLRKKPKQVRTREQENLWVELQMRLQMPPKSNTSFDLNETSAPTSPDTAAPIVMAPSPPVKMYQAVHNYTATHDSQMNLKQGDVLQVMETSDNGWWKGVALDGSASGWFPSGFVVELPAVTPVSESGPMTQHSFPGNLDVESQRPENEISTFRIKKHGRPPMPADLGKPEPYFTLAEKEGTDHVETWVKMAASMSISSLPSIDNFTTTSSLVGYNVGVKGHKFRAIYAYKPVCKGEMGLKEGELVVCKERDKNGWMLGKNRWTEEEGWFPAVYVDEVSSDDDSVTESDIPQTYEVLETNKSYSPSKAWTGIEHRAVHSYRSTTTGDLKLEPNDVVVVLQTLANGWWFGIKGSHSGWFPGLYVEMTEAKATPGTVQPNLTRDQSETAGNNGLPQPEAITGEQKTPSRQSTPRVTPEKQIVPESGNNQVTPLRLPVKPTTPALDSATPSPRGSVVSYLSTDSHQPGAARPKRKAPPPPHSKPYRPKLSTETPPAANSLRRPSRPAPTPPKRQASKLSDDTISEKNDDLCNPVAQLKEKPIVYINGKRPIITKVSCGDFDEKSLNPMSKPAKRGFAPVPGKTYRRKKHKKGNQRNLSVANSENIHPISPTHSNFSFDNKTKSSSKSSLESEITSASAAMVTSHPQQKTGSHAMFRDRNDSHAISAALIMANSNRLRHSLTNPSPSPSGDSGRASPRVEFHSKPNSAFTKPTPKHHYTLTTVAPPTVPLERQPSPFVTNGNISDEIDVIIPRAQLKTYQSQEVGRPTMSTFASDTKTNHITKKVSDAGSQRSTTPISRKTSNGTQPSAVDGQGSRESLVVTPGKVQELVQQINMLSPTSLQDENQDKPNWSLYRKQSNAKQPEMHVPPQNGTDSASDPELPPPPNGFTYGGPNTNGAFQPLPDPVDKLVPYPVTFEPEAYPAEGGVDIPYLDLDISFTDIPLPPPEKITEL